MPISRVQKNTNIEIAAISPLTPRVHSKSKEDVLPKQMNLRHRIQEATQARLPHPHNMQLHQQEQRERVQLVWDDKRESTSIIDNSFETPNTKKYGINWQLMNLEDSPKE